MKKMKYFCRLLLLFFAFFVGWTVPGVAWAANVVISSVEGFTPAVSKPNDNQGTADLPYPQPNHSPQVISPTLGESTTAWFAGHQWVIIGWDGKGVASEQGKGTLFYANANNNKPTSLFGSNNEYAGSTLQDRLKLINFFVAPTPKEMYCIEPRSLEGGSGNFTSRGTMDEISAESFSAAAGNASENEYVTGYYLGSANTFDWYAYDVMRRNGTIGTGVLNEYIGDYRPDRVAGDATVGSLWPLSVAEASLLDTSIREYSSFWWLRSPGDHSLRACLKSFQ
jgi:hypothetical protein